MIALVHQNHMKATVWTNESSENNFKQRTGVHIMNDTTSTINITHIRCSFLRIYTRELVWKRATLKEVNHTWFETRFLQWSLLHHDRNFAGKCSTNSIGLKRILTVKKKKIIPKTTAYCFKSTLLSWIRAVQYRRATESCGMLHAACCMSEQAGDFK
jgi:hypothetical protein